MHIPMSFNSNSMWFHWLTWLMALFPVTNTVLLKSIPIFGVHCSMNMPSILTEPYSWMIQPRYSMQLIALAFARLSRSDIQIFLSHRELLGDRESMILMSYSRDSRPSVDHERCETG